MSKTDTYLSLEGAPPSPCLMTSQILTGLPLREAKILGGRMYGAHVVDMVSEIALAIERAANSLDIGGSIYPPPRLVA